MIGGSIPPPYHFTSYNSYKVESILTKFAQISELTWIASQTCCRDVCWKLHKTLKHHTVICTQSASIASMRAVTVIRPLVLEDLLLAIWISAFHSKILKCTSTRLLLVDLRHGKQEELQARKTFQLTSKVLDSCSSNCTVKLINSKP